MGDEKKGKRSVLYPAFEVKPAFRGKKSDCSFVFWVNYCAKISP